MNVRSAEAIAKDLKGLAQGHREDAEKLRADIAELQRRAAEHERDAAKCEVLAHRRRIEIRDYLQRRQDACGVID